MTYTLFLQIEDDSKLDPTDRIVKVANISEADDPDDANSDFYDALRALKYEGFSPSELDT
jgi:hypothetical protein